MDHFPDAAALTAYAASDQSSAATLGNSEPQQRLRRRPLAAAGQLNPFSWAALNGGKAFEHIG